MIAAPYALPTIPSGCSVPELCDRSGSVFGRWKQYVATDLAQLFRRVAFNVAVGNRDDHLRNHGFLLGKTGWRLAPAFDVNPNIDKAEHVLNLDDGDNRPSLETVLNTAEFYGITYDSARKILEEVASAVDQWESIARKEHIAAADIDL